MRMFVDPQAVYLHREPIDFRVGIDGLAMRVERKRFSNYTLPLIL